MTTSPRPSEVGAAGDLTPCLEAAVTEQAEGSGEEEEALEVEIMEASVVGEAGAAFVEAEVDGVMVVETGAGVGEAVAGAGAVVAGEEAGVGGEVEVASGEDTDHEFLFYYVFDLI